MYTEELYIENQLADLAPSPPIALTLQVNDLATVADRQSAYSNTIKLPKNKINKAIFGNADTDAFTQHQPYASLKAKYNQTGTEVVPAGIVNLQAVSDSFEIQLTYGVSGWLDIVGNYKLTDLDWSDIPNFQWDVPTIANSMIGTGQPWPIVDYGGSIDESATIDINYLRPALTTLQILQHIASFAQYVKPSEPTVFYSGYQFLGSILSNSTFLNEFIPLCDTKFFNSFGLVAAVGDTISIAKNVPDIAITDFIKDFMQRYFLTPVIDNVSRTFTFKSFDELYANKSIAKNWTKKFVNDARQDGFILGEYAQANNFKWATDEAFLNAGNSVLLIDNQTLPQSVDAITSIFANTNTSTGMIGGLNIARIMKFKIPPNSSHPPFDVDTARRILTLRTASAGLYKLTDGINNQIVGKIMYGFFATQFDLAIGWPGMIAAFGTGFKKLINKVRVITRYVILTPLDVANLDFFIPVYDELEAKYYYVNRVTNYIQGQKCKVQFIRM